MTESSFGHGNTNQDREGSNPSEMVLTVADHTFRIPPGESHQLTTLRRVAPAVAGHLLKLSDHAYRLAKTAASRTANAEFGEAAKSYDEAISSFEQLALQIAHRGFEQNLADCIFNRAVTYHRAGDLKPASRDYTEAIKLGRNLGESYYNRGLIHSRLGDFEAAIRDYDEAHDRMRDGALVYAARGVAHGQIGNSDQAIADFTKAIDRKPKDAASYHNRGVERLKARSPTEAIADLNRAIELDPEEPISYFYRGQALGRVGSYDEAIEDFAYAIRRDSDCLIPYLRVAKQWILEVQFEAAITALTDILVCDPKNAEAFSLRGSARLATARFAEAHRDFSTAIDLGPPTSDLYAKRAVAAAQTDPHAALSDLQKAAELATSDSDRTAMLDLLAAAPFPPRPQPPGATVAFDAALGQSTAEVDDVSLTEHVEPKQRPQQASIISAKTTADTIVELLKSSRLPPGELWRVREALDARLGASPPPRPEGTQPGDSTDQAPDRSSAPDASRAEVPVEELEKIHAAERYQAMQRKVFGERKPTLAGFQRYLKGLQRQTETTYREKTDICRTVNFWKRELKLDFFYRGQRCKLGPKGPSGDEGGYQLKPAGSKRKKSLYGQAAFPPLECRKPRRS